MSADSFALPTVVLWTHALSGVVWIGACACFILAASGFAAGSQEWREFALRAAPVINRITLGAALLLPITGVVNLLLAGGARRFHFPAVFLEVLGAKVMLYGAMTLALFKAWRTEGEMRRRLETAAAGESVGALGRLVRLYAAAAVFGALALVLGLWLAGS